MFIEIATHAAITGTFQAYEHSKELHELWSKFHYFIKHKKLSVLIIGPGGVGKTTLSHFLAHPSHKVPPKKYDESFHVEKFSLPGGVFAELLTAPGQARHFGSWEEMFDKVKTNGRTFGIINVVGYGYHSTTIDMKELRDANQTTQSAISRYFGDCRVREIAIAGGLVDRLKKHNKPFWMITLATKQDLWWPDRTLVDKHYRDGAYAAAIDKLQEAHHIAGFRHEYFSLALHSQNFADGGGNILLPTAEGYDDVLKYAHQEKLLQIIKGFVSPDTA